MQECARSVSQRAWSRPVDLMQFQGLGKSKLFERMETNLDEEDEVDCWSNMPGRIGWHSVHSNYFKLKPS
jgi:hypothetical protein